MSNAIIRTTALTKTYGRGQAASHALRGVSLEIEKSSFTCIVGPSGHGKSTLLQLIGGLDAPSGGQIHLDGTEINRLAPRDLARLRGRKIGFVFQFFNLLRSLSAQENVETAMMLSGLPAKEQASRARELLTLVGLADKLSARPGELSGGQQQRVAIARALANDPDILMMDEPTGNLDSVSEAAIVELLQSLHSRGKTLILVTHNNDIAAKAQRVIRIQDGLVAA